MNSNDKNFEEALKGLPEKKLSWRADRRIRKMIRERATELDGKARTWNFFFKLASVPVAMVLILTSTGLFGFYSPSVVQGDFLYPVKSELESAFYPDEGDSQERIAYHLWLSERRYAAPDVFGANRTQGR